MAGRANDLISVRRVSRLSKLHALSSALWYCSPNNSPIAQLTCGLLGEQYERSDHGIMERKRVSSRSQPIDASPLNQSICLLQGLSNVAGLGDTLASVAVTVSGFSRYGSLSGTDCFHLSIDCFLAGRNDARARSRRQHGAENHTHQGTVDAPLWLSMTDCILIPLYSCLQVERIAVTDDMDVDELRRLGTVDGLSIDFPFPYDTVFLAVTYSL